MKLGLIVLCLWFARAGTVFFVAGTVSIAAVPDAPETSTLFVAFSISVNTLFAGGLWMLGDALNALAQKPKDNPPA